LDFLETGKLTGSNQDAAQVVHERDEPGASIFIVAKLVEAREARTEQNIVATPGDAICKPDGLRKIGADRMGNLAGPAQRGEHVTGLSDYKHVFNMRDKPAHERRHVPALRFAARDQDDRRGKSGDRRLDRMEIGGLGIVPISHAAKFAHPRQSVRPEPERSGRRIKRGLSQAGAAPPGRGQQKIFPLRITTL